MIGELSIRLGDELILATEWSLLRALAIPEISKTFAGTGRYFEQTGDRQQSAMRVIHLLLREGTATREIQEMLQRVHRLHQSHGVPDVYIKYVLGLLLVGIPDWFARFSSTKIHDYDLSILLDFVNSVANLSGCAERDFSCQDWTFHQWHQFVHEFETIRRGFCVENRLMYETMAEIFASRLPKLFQGLSRSSFLAATPPELREFVGFRDLHLIERILCSASVWCRVHVRLLSPLFKAMDKMMAAKDLNDS